MTDYCQREAHLCAYTPTAPGFVFQARHGCVLPQPRRSSARCMAPRRCATRRGAPLRLLRADAVRLSRANHCSSLGSSRDSLGSFARASASRLPVVRWPCDRGHSGTPDCPCDAMPCYAAPCRAISVLDCNELHLAVHCCARLGNDQPSWYTSYVVCTCMKT